MAEPASETSIKQLLVITEVEKLLKGSEDQIISQLDNNVQQALNGRTASASQLEVIANMKNKIITLIQGELAWEKLEPMYLRQYQETFTEEEVAGMLSFYKTVAGQAVIKKLPILMQSMMLDLQNTYARLIPQLQKIEQDFITEINAVSE